VNEKILSEIGENNSSGFQSTMSDNCFIRLFPKMLLSDTRGCCTGVFHSHY